MFTGIIESFGEVREAAATGANRTFWLRSDLAPQLKIDQSLSHDGVCLTVEEINGDHYRVTAVAETLDKTALGRWTTGTLVNLERSLLPSSRLDGHFVQGHVDTTGTCAKIRERQGSWEMTFTFPKEFARLVIEKGSICLNGISLTVFKVRKKRFTVAIIPYTFAHTNVKQLAEGDAVNLEFDLIGKYLLRSARL
ncbi:MAG: riboflavin synthase [Flaviaesturariibacter sp.]|nr:riboflavin synthase [Flaviaesturariibacter sp.]